MNFPFCWKNVLDTFCSVETWYFTNGLELNRIRYCRLHWGKVTFTHPSSCCPRNMTPRKLPLHGTLQYCAIRYFNTSLHLSPAFVRGPTPHFNSYVRGHHSAHLRLDTNHHQFMCSWDPLIRLLAA